MKTATVSVRAVGLADLRRNLNLTQTDLAQRSGLSRSYVHQIEAGCLPKWDTPGWVAYCDALDVSPDDARRLARGDLA